MLTLMLALSLTPFLDDSGARRVQEILHAKKTEASEMEYQRLVNRQTLHDLMLVYDPANRAKLLISYPEFSPDESRGGGDLGFGLHVMKRLRLGEKVIDVNEHWAADRATGSLFAPDEIRIKTLAFKGERHVQSSHLLYLYDVIRLAWGSDGRAKICRRTRFDADGHTKQMRVPASSPSSCQACHIPGAKFADRFLQPGEKRDYEAIVGDGFLKLPLAESFGLKDYLTYLGARDGKTTDAREKLLSPRENLMPAAVVDAAKRALDEECWLGADERLDDEAPLQQGVYRRTKGTFRDAIESVVPGKYDTWLPKKMIP